MLVPPSAAPGIAQEMPALPKDELGRWRPFARYPRVFVTRTP